MRILYLLRHAKSDWSGKADDHARRLSARGKRTAPRYWVCRYHSYDLPAARKERTARRAPKDKFAAQADFAARPGLRRYFGLAPGKPAHHIFGEAGEYGALARPEVAR